MQSTPKSYRLHIGIFGRRNVGKSSLLNALTRQETSIVSCIPGTTTDPVEKAMELLPLGPVLLIDTAGLDDHDPLGPQRISSTLRSLNKIDAAILLCLPEEWTSYETNLLSSLKERKIPTLIIFNKSDLAYPSESLLAQIGHPYILTISAKTGEGISNLPQKLFEILPESLFEHPSLVADLIPPGKITILVVPIDSAAPKGRLILPQVQTLRDILDAGLTALVCRETELSRTLRLFNDNEKPGLIITDSQAFKIVNALTPQDIPLTSFSILFARLQGDLVQMAHGAIALAKLQPGDRVLIAEACTHHPSHEDIGTVKIPKILQQRVGGTLEFHWSHGCNLPQNLSSFKAVIHCGACVWNRRAMLNRIYQCTKAGIPITNYGLAISFSLGILERALRPFPEAHKICFGQHSA